MTPDWITTIANKMSVEADSQLMAIAEEAAKRHGISTVVLSQGDNVKLACCLNEVQTQSFALGVHMAFSVIKDVYLQASTQNPVNPTPLTPVG